MSTLTFKGQLRRRSYRMQLTGLTDNQFDIGNLWRHIVRSLAIHTRHEREAKRLSLNSMRKLWHAHMNTIKRALSYTKCQLIQACKLLVENKVIEAIEVLLSTGLPELRIMARLRNGVVQACSSSTVAKYSRSISGRGNETSDVPSANKDRESNNGVMTPYGEPKSGHTADDIREGYFKISLPIPRLMLPTGSNARLGLVPGAPAPTPRGVLPPCASKADTASPFEGSTSFHSWELKSFLNRFINPETWRRYKSHLLRRCHMSAKNAPLKQIVNDARIAKRQGGTIDSLNTNRNRGCCLPKQA